MTTTRSPKPAPEYAIHREIADAADTLPETDKKRGINLKGYEIAQIQVIPTAGTPNPNVEVLSWSDVAGRFVKQNPAAAKTGLGASIPYEFGFEAESRILFVAVTGGVSPGDKVTIAVAGSLLDHGL